MRPLLLAAAGLALPNLLAELDVPFWLSIPIALVFLVESAAQVWLVARADWFVRQPYSRQEFRIATDVLPQLDPVARFECNADGERGDPLPGDVRTSYISPRRELQGYTDFDLTLPASSGEDGKRTRAAVRATERVLRGALVRGMAFRRSFPAPTAMHGVAMSAGSLLAQHRSVRP